MDRLDLTVPLNILLLNPSQWFSSWICSSHMWNISRRPIIAFPLLDYYRGILKIAHTRRKSWKHTRKSIIHSSVICGDMFLSVKAMEHNLLQTIFTQLETYQKWSGQSINRAKSMIFFDSNKPNASRKSICQPLNLQEGKMNSQYLGPPLHIQRRPLQTRYLQGQHLGNSWLCLRLVEQF